MNIVKPDYTQPYDPVRIEAFPILRKALHTR